jgi:hypothetical protein
MKPKIMKINLLFVGLGMRKTFFSILILLFNLNFFSQLKQDSTIKYPDCIQVSPMFLFEPYTSCLHVTWERQYRPELYFSTSLGLIFNEAFALNQDNPQEQSGFRIGFDVKRCIHRSEDIKQRRNIHLLIGVEPYFKYITTQRYDNYGQALNNIDAKFTYSKEDISNSKNYLYKLERKQAGVILKFTIKRSINKFTFNVEWGSRIFYKINKITGVPDNEILYVTENQYLFTEDYLTRFDKWVIRPYVNVKIGRRF